jgi:SAM-dependent methyltransferase
VGNGRVRKPYTFKNLETEIKAQIDNALAVGWKIEDIMLVTNFGYEYKGVKATIVQLNDFCMTGSKTFAILELMKQGLVNGPVWLHDLDVWQNEWFDLPEFKDVGICTYSTPKFNGGSVFYRPSAQDMIQKVVDEIIRKEEQQEEPTINRIYKSDEYVDRVTVCDQTYNLGCYDRNMLGDDKIPVNERLRKLLFSYFPEKLKAYNLEVNGKKAQIEAGILDPNTGKKITKVQNKEVKPVMAEQRTLTEIDILKKNRDSLMAQFDAIRSVKDSPQYKEQWEDLRRQWKLNETYIKYLETPEKMYDPKYYERHFNEYREWEIRLAKFFSDRYKINSVIDIGCGVGSYLEGHVRSGVTKVRGLEYNYKSAVGYFPDILKPHISYADATKPLDINDKFDCAWSVEVAEHIMPSGTEQFIDNLTSLTENYILLTAAPPGQSGTGHIKLREKQFWIDAIKAKGFDYLEDEVKVLQEEWKKLGAEWYITKNVMLFKKK